MADINIVRKPPLWPWLATLAALLLVIVLIVWVANRGDEPQLAGGYAEPETQGTSGIAPSAMNEYLQFAGVAGDGEQPQPGREHEYTAEGLRKLAAALESLERTRPGAVRDGAVDEIRSHADRIQRDPTSRQHANAVRDAFLNVADAIPGGGGLRDDAEAISPEQPLLEQTDAIRAFFEESGRALQSASRNI